MEEGRNLFISLKFFFFFFFGGVFTGRSSGKEKI